MTHTTLSGWRSPLGAAIPCFLRVAAAGLALVLVLALATAMAQAQTAGGPASPSTLEFNKNATASLPWSDEADFANAKRA